MDRTITLTERDAEALLPILHDVLIAYDEAAIDVIIADREMSDLNKHARVVVIRLLTELQSVPTSRLLSEDRRSVAALARPRLVVGMSWRMS